MSDFWGDTLKNVSNFVGGIATGNFGGSTKPKAGTRARVGGGTFGTPKKTSTAAAGNPWDDLYSWADQFGTESGGSGGGGGGGGGDAYGALMAAINQQKANAGNRYNDQKGQINQIYTQYADSLKPNADATKASYQTAINAANTAGQGIANTTTQRAAANDQQRDAALATLGVTGAATDKGAESAAVNEGLTSLAKDNASWGNLENVLSNAQQSRDRLDVQGATDAGVLAQKQLTDTYEQYMRTLDQQAAGAASSGGGGGGSSGGGSGGTYKNPMLDMINKAIGNDMIAQALGTGRYDPSKQKTTFTDKQIASAYSKVNSYLKKNPKATETQIKANVGPGAWKAYSS